MNAVKVGFAMCGSFCTFSKALEQMDFLINQGYEIIPIMSFNAYSTDTRFGKANDICDKIRDLCKRDIIHTIKDAEPIGPKKMTDLMLVAPCTGNTLAKLANAVTMNTRHYYFVPFRQDNPFEKPNSLVADFSLIPDTLSNALDNKQLQPVLI